MTLGTKSRPKRKDQGHPMGHQGQTLLHQCRDLDRRQSRRPSKAQDFTAEKTNRSPAICVDTATTGHVSGSQGTGCCELFPHCIVVCYCFTWLSHFLYISWQKYHVFQLTVLQGYINELCELKEGMLY